MPKLVWDKDGEHLYETGVNQGVLYMVKKATGENEKDDPYGTAYVWNGLTSVTEKPTGAEANSQYADNIKYLNLISAEEFEATIEAFTYPDAFAECDGSIALLKGLYIGQQSRKTFGLSYKTLIGNDQDGTAHGYKIHLIYGCTASPSEKQYQTVNDNPEAMTLSWDLKTVPTNVKIGDAEYKPTATLIIDSTKFETAKMTALEAVLYGSDAASGVGGTDARMPLPSEVYRILSATTQGSGT